MAQKLQDIPPPQCPYCGHSLVFDFNDWWKCVNPNCWALKKTRLHSKPHVGVDLAKPGSDYTVKHERCGDRTISINITFNCGCCCCPPCPKPPKFSRSILSIKAISMQQYLVNIDPNVDSSATAEVLVVKDASGNTIDTLPVDITQTQTVFQVDDPAILNGATAYLVDSNAAGDAPQSSPVNIPPVPPPPTPPTFSRQIVDIVPLTGLGTKAAARKGSLRKVS